MGEIKFCFLKQDIEIKKFGDKLKEYRILNSLSYNKLAKATGVDTSTIKNIEKNKGKQGKKNYKKIEDYIMSRF